MIKRKKPELYLSILESLVDGPLIVTHLMNKTGIGYARLMFYTKNLVDHGLIEKIEPSPSHRNKRRKRRDGRVKYLYHITEYGRDVLKQDIRLCWKFDNGE